MTLNSLIVLLLSFDLTSGLDTASYIIASERLGDSSVVVCMSSNGENGGGSFDVDERRSFALDGG